MAKLFNWYFIDTKAEFVANIPSAENTNMYFIKDTKEIFRGNESFSGSVNLYTGELGSIVNPAVNKLYVNSDTLQGSIYNGTSWVTVIRPVSDTVTTDGADPVSSKAVISYVTAALESFSTSKDTIKDVDWDSTDVSLTITKGDGSTEIIDFDGIGVSLSYAKETGALTLLDKAGTQLGDAIQLDLERFVKSGEYDVDNKNIILYFDDDKTEKVEIPVGELIDIYTAEGDNAIDLSVGTGNVIKGTIKISSTDGNAIEVKDDGLYVTPTDISGKIDKVDGAVEGNIATLAADGSLVDSGMQFDDILPNNHVYTGSTLEEAINGVTAIKGDVAIVKTPIGETGKFERKVYTYDYETTHNAEGEIVTTETLSWIPFDEQYNADNVILAEDLIATTKIGVLQTLTNGQVTVAKAGSSIKQAIQAIVAKESNPSVAWPVVSFSDQTVFKAYEVGTKVTPKVTASLSSGTYSYGSIKDDTGVVSTGTSANVTAKSWAFSDSASTASDSVTVSGATATYPEITVEEGTSYKVTATATINNSEYTPITNMKNPVASLKITEDNANGGNASSNSKKTMTPSATTGTITGYRNCFYGTVTSKGDVTSDVIRALTATNAAVKAGTSFNLSIPVGTMRAIIAYPADASGLSAATILASVKDANASDAQVNSAFTLMTVSVEGASAGYAKNYKVFVKDWAEAVTTANTYKVTL